MPLKKKMAFLAFLKLWNRMSSLGNSKSVVYFLFFLAAGISSLVAFYSIFTAPFSPSNIQLGVFVDRLPVSLSTFKLGDESISIDVDHFVVFQNYLVVPFPTTLVESYFFAGLIGLLSITLLTSLSYLKKLPFLVAGAGWIFLLTLTNLNGLNTGGPSSNLPLLLFLVATLIPTLYFHVWGSNTPYWIRWITLACAIGGTLYWVVSMSPLVQPLLYVSEHSLLLGIGMGGAWIFWQGHGILSGLLVVISRTNAGFKTKTPLQFSVIAVAYLSLLFLLLLNLKGEASLPFSNFSVLYLIFPLGILGWISTQQKFTQSNQLAGPSFILKSLFIIGFIALVWTVWKLKIAHNQAGEELIKHLLTYSQFGFSLFFFIYLGVNFFPLMQQGKAVHAILYKPYILPYYHLRIGGVIVFMVLTTYLEAIIASQLNSLTSNVVGDYYYQTNQKLEASIFYESSWDRYRYNPKAKNVLAQLLVELNQPSLAKEHLEESFDNAPQVDNILLLADRLQRENKYFEALFYLENGLKYYPNNPILSQNLSLLYSLLKKENQGLQLLTDLPEKDPITASNLMGLQLKMGKPIDLNEEKVSGIHLINQITAQRKFGKEVGQDKLQKLRDFLAKENTPVVLLAGYRNLFSSINLEDPSSDLRLLDSLATREDLIDYSMQFQETAVIRSLGAGRITESVKNLNGLAFRNPGDAAYYLNLTGLILAQNLDFEKASRDFLVSEQKGFQAQLPLHRAVSSWSKNFKDSLYNQAPSPLEATVSFLGNFNETLPQNLFESWKTSAPEGLKLEIALRLLSQKAHGLTALQIQEIGTYLVGKVDLEKDLSIFQNKFDLTNPSSLLALIRFIGCSEELTANPYLSPLIWAAAKQSKNLLQGYELLQTATEFNKDPLLWALKIQTAKKLGLDNYAAIAREEMKAWMQEGEIESALNEVY